jgi:hypothetical protein
MRVEANDLRTGQLGQLLLSFKVVRYDDIPYVQSRLFTGPTENAEELSKSDFVWSLPETGYANWTEKDAKSYHLWEYEFGLPAEDAPAAENEQGGEQKVIVIEDENEDAEDNTVEWSESEDEGDDGPPTKKARTSCKLSSGWESDHSTNMYVTEE